MPRRSGSCVSSTTAQARRYRWAILSAGVFAQAAFSAILLGLPSIAPAIQQHYRLSLTQVGIVLAAVNFGAILTMLPWGLVADRIGERAVIVIGQVGAGAALVAAGSTSSYGSVVAALAVVGLLGAGVNAASGRAVWKKSCEPRVVRMAATMQATVRAASVASGALLALSSKL